MRRLLPILLAAALPWGCATSPARFYTLTSMAVPDGAPATRCAVVVGPVSVPTTVDRPEFVVQVAPNRVDIDEFNRWAGPLGDGIARTLAGDLAVLLGTPNVAVAPLANFEPTHRVTVDVQRFESVPGESVLVEAVWVVRRSTGGAVRSGRTVAREPVSEKGYAALAAAHGRALATVSGDIAAAIRETPPAAR